MEGHIRAVGILNIIMGAFGVLIALAILLAFGGIAGIVGASGDPEAQVAVPILGVIGFVIFIIVAVTSIPLLLAGWGILTYREWARILGIVLAAINLLNVPIGTAIGVYSLWVLVQERTAQMFRAAKTGLMY
ncbi:MAG: hypothetical protein ACM3ZB_01820 [bacterium]|jgi:hypothetical protein